MNQPLRPAPVLYNLHEFNRALLRPATHLAQAGANMFSAPGSWLAHLPGAGPLAAGYELFYRLGKDYEKPRFDIHAVEVRGDVGLGGRTDRAVAGRSVACSASSATATRPTSSPA